MDDYFISRLNAAEVKELTLFTSEGTPNMGLANGNKEQSTSEKGSYEPASDGQRARIMNSTEQEVQLLVPVSGSERHVNRLHSCPRLNTCNCKQCRPRPALHKSCLGSALGKLLVSADGVLTCLRGLSKRQKNSGLGPTSPAIFVVRSPQSGMTTMIKSPPFHYAIVYWKRWSCWLSMTRSLTSLR